MKKLFALCICFLISSCATTTKRTVQSISVDILSETVEYSQSKAPSASWFAVRPSVVILSNSGWTKIDVLQRLKMMNKILAQCELYLNQVKVIEVQARDQWQAVGYKNSDEIYDVASQVYVTRPTIYFVGSVKENRPLSFYEPLVSYGDPIADTAWIPVSDQGSYDKQIEKGNETVTHELAHIMAKAGHNVLANNLLHEYDSRAGSKLEPAQCKAIRQRCLGQF